MRSKAHAGKLYGLQLGCLYKKGWNGPHRPQAGIGFGYLTHLGPAEEELKRNESRIYYLWTNSQALAPYSQHWKQRRCYHCSATSGVFTSLGKLGMKHILYRKKERSWKILGWLLKHEKDWRNIWNRNCGAIPQSNNGTGSRTIAWNNKWHSWGLTAVLEKFAVETLSNLNTKCFYGKCDRSINVWISTAYQCGMRSKKLCSVGWGESSSFIKHLSSGQLHYHNTELLYHETNILPQKDSLVDRLGILCIVCKFCLCTTAGFKKGER